MRFPQKALIFVLGLGQSDQLDPEVIHHRNPSVSNKPGPLATTGRSLPPVYLKKTDPGTLQHLSSGVMLLQCKPRPQQVSHAHSRWNRVRPLGASLVDIA